MIISGIAPLKVIRNGLAPVNDLSRNIVIEDSNANI